MAVLSLLYGYRLVSTLSRKQQLKYTEGADLLIQNLTTQFHGHFQIIQTHSWFKVDFAVHHLMNARTFDFGVKGKHVYVCLYL